MRKKMSKFTYSPNQEKALSLARENMIVSAGAGSGKTAVLVERLYRIFTTGKTATNEVLALTFTNLAAREMKERIKDKIVEKGGDSRLNDEIDVADITTFDTFALKILKKYGYYLNYDKNVGNLDETIALAKLKIYFDEQLDVLFNEQNKEFIRFYEKYFHRDKLDQLYEILFSFHRLVSLKIDPLSFIDSYLDNYYSLEAFETYYHDFNGLIIDYIRKIASLIKQLENSKQIDKYENFLSIAGSILTLDELSAKAEQIKYQRALPDRNGEFPGDKAINEQINKLFAALHGLRAFTGKNDLYANFLIEKEEVILLIDIYKKAYLKLEQFKQTFNVYTFSDIARLAYSLVLLPHVAEELKNQYKYILIDEYQDTSDIQEAFVAAISNNNVYQVGDIKQSIYAFRNANSELFASKFAKFKKGEGGVAVSLNDNYRSRPEVLNDINAIFSEVMTRDLGGASYRQEHIIGIGNKDYRDHEQKDGKYGLNVYNYIPEERELRKKEEIEAQIIINDIQEKLANGYKVFDGKNKMLREATYGDFTILINKKGHFEVFEKMFRENAIPLLVEKDEKLTDQKVLIALRSALTLFSSYCKHEQPESQVFRRAAASFLRSFVIEYTDQQLLDLFNPNPSLFPFDPVLMKFKALADEHHDKTPGEVSRLLVNTFKIDEALFKLKDILISTNTLTSLLDRIDDYSSFNFTLDEVINEFTTKREEDEKGSVERFTSAINAVKLMSIHASKGLEFPLVYFAGLQNKIVYPEKTYMVTPDHGFVFKTNDLPNFNYYLYYAKQSKSIISEQMRLLYVAATRAKEALYLIHANVQDKVVKELSSAKMLFEIFYASNYYRQKVTNVSTIPIKAIINTKQKEDHLLSAPSFREINLSFKGEEKVVTVVNAEQNILDRGTLLHRYFEMYDFKTKDLSYIKLSSDVKILQNLIAHPIFKNATNENVYREYTYFDETSKQLKIIDCFIIEKNQITLLDFKLTTVDKEEYRNQVKTYASYLKRAFKSKIKAYLVSLTLLQFEEVAINE